MRKVLARDVKVGDVIRDSPGFTEFTTSGRVVKITTFNGVYNFVVRDSGVNGGIVRNSFECVWSD